MKNKKSEQQLRNETAKYLVVWKKTYSIDKTSEYFGHRNSKTIRILRRSEMYVKAQGRKKRNLKFLKIKWHPLRIKIAIYLNDWRNGLNIKGIALKHKTYRPIVNKYLMYSKSYVNSPKRLTREEQMGKKWSPFRKKVAKYLKEWKNDKNLYHLSKKFGVSTNQLQFALWQSESYRKYHYLKRAKLSQEDQDFILRFAKKIKLASMIGSVCHHCGEDNIFVLDFHHLKNKKETMAVLLDANMDDAIDEVKKCILLCRNCHMLEHSNIDLFEKYKDIIKYRSVRI